MIENKKNELLAKGERFVLMSAFGGVNVEDLLELGAELAREGWIDEPMVGRSTALAWAAELQSATAVKALLGLGANPSAPCGRAGAVKTFVQNDEPPLHRAARAGAGESVVALLEAGARADALDQKGLSALDVGRGSALEALEAHAQREALDQATAPAASSRAGPRV
jgi:hypothetical protein